MMIKPIGLIHGHYECRSFEETMPIFTDLLALEVIREGDREIVVKHPNTDWQLIVHEAGPEAADKPVMNHYGVRVSSWEEVDAAWKYIREHKEKYRIPKLTRPGEVHLAHSFYFVEPGGNYWEIESYLPDSFDTASVYAPHWKAPWPEDKFPGKGYIPQGLTHGTLECDDKAVTERFLREVLGLEIVPGEREVVYFKHPTTPWYVVVVPMRKRRYLNANSRYTLELESPDAVREAYRNFSQSGNEVGIQELGVLRQLSGGVSFFLSDPDRNWWEITSRVNS